MCSDNSAELLHFLYSAEEDEEKLYNVALVGAEPEILDRLEKTLQSVSEETGVSFRAARFGDGDEIVENYGGKFDLIVMDTDMPRLNGIRTAEYIRRLDRWVEILFIAARAENALQGYDVGAFDYMLKPFEDGVFAAKIKRFIERAKRKPYGSILIPTRSGVERLMTNEIVYIESFKHKLIFYTEFEKYEIVGTMKDIETKLKSGAFFRCNSGYLVNLLMVRRVSGDMAFLIDGTALKISRARKKQFIEQLNGSCGQARC